MRMASSNRRQDSDVGTLSREKRTDDAQPQHFLMQFDSNACTIPHFCSSSQAITNRSTRLATPGADCNTDLDEERRNKAIGNPGNIYDLYDLHDPRNWRIQGRRNKAIGKRGGISGLEEGM